MAWIDYDFYISHINTSATRKKRKHQLAFPDAAVSPITLDSALHSTSTAKKARKQIMRNSQITDDSLHPEFGRLRLRLNKHLDHLPAETNSSTSARCGFHRWLGHETCKSVSFCATCNVNLCVRCYKIFHQEEHLVEQKDALKIKLDPKPKSTDKIG